jgi:copper chaperone
MITLKIDDMTCGRCAGTISRAVAGVDKEARVEVDIPARTVRIASTAADSELLEAIQEAGYTPQAVPDSAAASPARPGGGCCCG